VQARAHSPPRRQQETETLGRRLAHSWPAKQPAAMSVAKGCRFQRASGRSGWRRFVTLYQMFSLPAIPLPRPREPAELLQSEPQRVTMTGFLTPGRSFNTWCHRSFNIRFISFVKHATLFDSNLRRGFSILIRKICLACGPNAGLGRQKENDIFKVT